MLDSTLGMCVLSAGVKAKIFYTYQRLRTLKKSNEILLLLKLFLVVAEHSFYM